MINIYPVKSDKSEKFEQQDLDLILFVDCLSPKVLHDMHMFHHLHHHPLLQSSHSRENRDASENHKNFLLRRQMSPKHALGNGVDVAHVLVGVVPTEDGEGDHQHVDHRVGKQGVAVVHQRLHQLLLHLRSSGQSWQHSGMRRPCKSRSSLLLK